MITKNYFFKTGKEDNSFYFNKQYREIQDRLNYLFYDPKYVILMDELKTKFQITSLKDVCLEPIHRGEQPKYAEDGEVAVIKTIDLKESYIAYSDCLKVSDEFFKAHPSAQLKYGDVIIASTGYGSLGKIGVHNSNNPTMVDGHISILRIREEYDPFYVACFLRSSYGQIQFERWFSGSSGQIEIQPEDLNRFILPNSTDNGIRKEKQTEIYLKAGLIEKEINSIREKIVKKNQAITYLSQSKLGITQSDIPPLPFLSNYSTVWLNRAEDRLDFVWNHPTSLMIRKYLMEHGAVPLSTLIEGEFEYGINASGKVEGKLPFVNIENLNLDGLIHAENILYLDEAPVSKLLRKDDLLISRSRTVGTAACVSEKETGYTFGSYILRFHVKKAVVDPQYIVNFINSPIGQAEIAYLQSGSKTVKRGGGNNINPNALKQFMVILPRTRSDRENFLHELSIHYSELAKAILEDREKTILYNKVFEDTIIEF